MLLCVGDFFADEQDLSDWLSYRNGTKKVPISTYILGSNSQQLSKFFESGNEDGFEFCDKLTYLGIVLFQLLCFVNLK